VPNGFALTADVYRDALGRPARLSCVARSRRPTGCWKANTAKRNHRHIGIFGEAPGNYQEIAQFLRNEAA
jgi:hypothetical protein